MMNLRPTLLTAIALFAAATQAPAARAEIVLSLSDGSNNVTLNDLGSPGMASFMGAIGNFTFSGDMGTGFPLAGTPDVALIDLSSLDLTSTLGGTLTISLTETGFAAKPGGAWFHSAITGNFFNSQATLNSYLDTGNIAFGTGTLLASNLVDNATGDVFEPSIAGPYSMTEIVTVDAGPHSMTSLDAMVIDAPEPGSLSLLGAGLLALTMVARRRRSAVGAIGLRA
jgi:hypothetical protein